MKLYRKAFFSFFAYNKEYNRHMPPRFVPSFVRYMGLLQNKIH